MPDRRTARLVTTIVAAVAIAIISIAGLRELVRHPDAALVQSDFAAFYCGSLVAARHQDPYALEPLAQCEYDQAYRPGGVSQGAASVDPDPLPGYDMAIFRPFTLLPFRTAALAFAAITIAAIVGTAVILADLTGLPSVVLGAILVYLDLYTSVPFGQTSPLAALGLALAAQGLARNRPGAVLGGAALTMLVPHVGFAVCCSLFLWRPQLRLGIVLLAAALAAVSFLTLGSQLNGEYLVIALPAQAIAESGTTFQYGLAWLLQYLGVAAPVAIKIASFQYSAFLVLSFTLARTVAVRMKTNAAIVLFPALAVLFGGTYVHIQQMVLALPFALVLATRRRSPAAWIAVALLAVPWPADQNVLLLGASAVVATIVLTADLSVNARTTAGLVCAGVVAYGLLAAPLTMRLLPTHPQHVLAAAPRLAHALDGDVLAAQADADEVRADPHAAIATPETLLTKLPTWLGLAILLALAFRRSSGAPPGDLANWDADRLDVGRRAAPAI